VTRYVALLDGKRYGLTVPDLPGCTSAAATTDEVLRRATEAVRLWAEDALADGEKLPSRGPSKHCAPIRRSRLRWRRGLRLRSYRLSSMLRGPPGVKS
jgi:predicted RNase H-like HicB family nuclease